MAFCGKCGAQIEDGAKFCSVCGAEVISAEQQNENAQTAETETKSDFGAKISGLNNTEDGYSIEQRHSSYILYRDS